MHELFVDSPVAIRRKTQTAPFAPYLLLENMVEKGVGIVKGLVATAAGEGCLVVCTLPVSRDVGGEKRIAVVWNA